MTLAPQPIATAVDQDGNVIADLPCRKCAYNLRSLNLNGRCPECGTAVGFSAQGDYLRFSDPTWVRTLARGAKLIIWGIVVAILGVIAIIALSAATDVRNAEYALPVLMLVAYGMIVVGTWFLTEPDPSGLGEDRYGTSRKLIRITLAMGILNFLVSLAEEATTLPPDTRRALQIVGAVFGLAAVVGFFAQLQYVRKLALRIPDPKLAARAKFLMFAIPISYGALVAVVLASLFGGAGSAAVQSLGCVAGIVGLALIVFGIMYLLMIGRLGRLLTDQAALAENTWAATNSPALPTA